jgi:hypothetical protein
MSTAMLVSAGGTVMVGAGAWFAMWWRRSRRRTILAHSQGTANTQHIHSGESHAHHE